MGLGGAGVSARATTGALVGGGVGGITVGTDACCGASGAGDAAGELPPQATMTVIDTARAIPTVADLKLRPVPIGLRISIIGATCARRFSRRLLLFLVECSIAVTRTAYKQYDA